jgi:hypothetical protein
MLLFSHPQSVVQAARESVESLTAKIGAIINGTTVVGHAADSDKLGGEEWSHYFNKDADSQEIYAETFQYVNEHHFGASFHDKWSVEFHDGSEYHEGDEHHHFWTPGGWEFHYGHEEHRGFVNHYEPINANGGIRVGFGWLTDNEGHPSAGSLTFDSGTGILWLFDGSNWRKVQLQ